MLENKIKLLVVDDDDFMLSSIELAFLGGPYEVTAVNDPFKAYQMIENQSFNIVICDIVMPGMDGLTLLEKIKNFNGMIQVIMITADITVNNAITAFRKGAIDIFFKPFKKVDDLVAAVDAAVNKLNRVNAILREAKKIGKVS